MHYIRALDMFTPPLNPTTNTILNTTSIPQTMNNEKHFDVQL